MFESLMAVGILIAFLIPGHLWRLAESRLAYLDSKTDWEKFAFGLLARSTIVYFPWSPLLRKAYLQSWYETAPLWSFAGVVMIAFVEPMVLGALWGRFRQRGGDRWIFERLGWQTWEQSHAPTAWDAMFTQRPESWIVVTLKDGTKVKGWFGVRSHASSDSESRDLYISHTVFTDENGNEQLVPNTGGVYLSADQIGTIEFVLQSETNA